MNRKTFDITKADDGWMIASTPAVDRDRDRVLPMGANLSNFAKNPVLIFGHNYSEPWAVIGRATETTVGADGIRFKPELRQAANEADPMNVIRLLWDDGLLKAASIGFKPLEWKDNEFGGRDFTKWEMLEISLVPIPANQEALRLAAKAIKAPEAVIDLPEVAVADGDDVPFELVAEIEVLETDDEGDEQPMAEAAGNAAPEDENEPETDDESALLSAISDFLTNVQMTLEE